MDPVGQNEEAAGMPLLRTCQTCFHAKIKCVKTQDSGVCDRCLRLNKTCVFAQSKRRVQVRAGERVPTPPVSRASRSAQQPPKPTKPQKPTKPSKTTKASKSSKPSKPSKPDSQQDVAQTGLEENNHDVTAWAPFAAGVLTVDRGQELLDLFIMRMNAHFPFVLVPPQPVQSLSYTKPALCLAVLTVASYDNPSAQLALGEQFNQLLSLRLANGEFASLELLQALLVQLAWYVQTPISKRAGDVLDMYIKFLQNNRAQYQPRPRKYSQQLGLAVSIVSDLRMDRPRNARLWGVDAHEDGIALEWGPDEIRALAGTYYLASSSAVLLQKSRTFYFSSYFLQQCQDLSMQSPEPTDKYLSLIIHTQHIIDAINDLIAGEPTFGLLPPLKARIDELRTEVIAMKANIFFPLSESRILSMQLHIAELLIDQSSRGEGLFGLDKLQENHLHHDGVGSFFTWLSDSAMAVKSIVNISLALPPADVPLITNLEWITLYCGLSLAARLDIVAAHPNVIGTTKRLRQFSDMEHVLRQTILRLESAAKDAGEQSVFLHLGIRATRLEEWYLNRLRQYAAGTSISGSSAGGYTPNMDPSLMLDCSANNTLDHLLVSEMMTCFESDSDFGAFSFPLPGSFDP
ncbi:hypothetical protein QQS21_011511 [Conoideocrella luteorostrata]|uniref:Zn(2)-C6 fungal-type domain-containing protein n=1 Tax=Conoideocrella luteorostrata TaxID=1105319 RepID=A0AAJ0CD84_9HYPO|nr:hypothetical protein QQS21_011511 [Conoideocrella luteorostrata]